jgi:hypothetical protein
MARLEEVFGVSTGVNSLSYVDRGKLDDELQRALKGGRHIVIQGGASKGSRGCDHVQFHVKTQSLFSAYQAQLLQLCSEKPWGKLAYLRH